MLEKAVLNKIRIPLLIVFLVLGFLIFKLLTPTEVIAQDNEVDFAKLQQIAQHNMGMVGQVGEDAIGIDPMEYLTTWNFNNLPKEERKKFYKETKRSDGSLIREYWFYIEDREIEVAPGIFFPAWAYNGQVPGPTIRVTEGDLVRIHFENRGTKPHTIHFHGFHTAEMDGAMKNQFVNPGDTFFYEFEAVPFGTHLYHCHSLPVSEHIHRGLYGTYIVDPKEDTRPKPDKELIMMMNGFDVNFDGENEIYSVNTIAFYFINNPIKVKQGELVRIYLTNILEFDQINSFHVHANFFDEYPTGTELEPDFYTDILIMGQGERSILDIRFKFPGKYMFHAHKTEFAELGWMGFFEVEE
ncbi:MAG: multicopper oxidase domain-containing protein [Nanoarchaeota archaeon]|nr:multicopper oxidase domain-containing protein [Nanoarchaeota archaeon]